MHLHFSGLPGLCGKKMYLCWYACCFMDFFQFWECDCSWLVVCFTIVWWSCHKIQAIIKLVAIASSFYFYTMMLMLHSNCRQRKCCISELEKLKMDNCISHQYRPPCKIAIEQHAVAARITSVSILNQVDCCLEVVNDKSSNQSKGDGSIEFSDDYDFLLDMESVGKSHTVEKANIMTKHLISSHANFVDGSDNLGEATG